MVFSPSQVTWHKLLNRTGTNGITWNWDVKSSLLVYPKPLYQIQLKDYKRKIPTDS